MEQVEDGASVTIGDVTDSSFSGNQQFYTYVDEWNDQFMCPDYAEKAKFNSLRGKHRNSRFRSLCWKVHLDCLPEDQTKWVIHTRKQRQKYKNLCENIPNNPRGCEVNGKSDLNINNPLSQDESSVWNQYFQNSELKVIIKQDVLRTFPEVEFFHMQWVQDIMIQVLFCYAKEFPDISYRQGMHELVAPILFVLHSDHQAFQHASEEGILKHFYSFTREMIRELMDPKFLEHDTYILFSHLMDCVEQWYQVRDIIPNKNNIYNIEPFMKPQEANLTNIIVLKLTRINDYLLKKHDAALYEHLEKLEIVPQIYGIRWLRLLYGREFPLQDLLVIWDAVFSDGPSLGLVDYIFVSMLMYIRSLLLSNDYAGCLAFLMRYPGISDVQYIIDHSLYLRDPMKFTKPTGYSEKMLKHVPTVGGVPNIHRAPNSTDVRQFPPIKKPQATARQSLSVARPNTLAFTDYVEINKNDCEYAKPSTKSNMSNRTETKSTIWRNADVRDGKKSSSRRRAGSKEEELAVIKSSPTKNVPPVPVPRSQNRIEHIVNSKSGKRIYELEEKLKDTEDMHSYCSAKMTNSIEMLQDVVLHKDMSDEDGMMLALAALKQVRDMLDGTLKFVPSLLESVTSPITAKPEDAKMASNFGAKSNTSSSNHVPPDIGVEALLSSEDNIEPQLGCIQFNECDSE